MKEYRVTVKVRNNLLLKAIEEKGERFGQKWCAANNLNYQTVLRFVNLLMSPITQEGTLRLSAQRLCDALEKLPEDLWSNEQLYPLEKNFSEIEMDHAQVVSMLPAEQQYYLPNFSELEQQQTNKVLNRAMAAAHISDQEKEVLRLRYEEDMTLDECGERMRLSRERIRQIEAKALRRLRHSSVAKLFDAGDLRP